jgi:hypothetical protein
VRAAGWLAALLAVFGLPCAATAQPDSSTYALVEGSTFQRGCFEPCACPIGQEQPLVGTFSLRPISDNGLFADYSIDDVRWKVDGSTYATPPNAAIAGAGTYTVGGEFAVQQQMKADLAVANEPPARFDSGLVAGGGGFPAEIDVEISRNGKYCFDTVMHVVARAQPDDCDVAYCPEPGGTALLSGAGVLALLYRRKAGSAFGFSRPTS